MAASHRVGLIIAFERLVAFVSLIACGSYWGSQLLRPLPLLVFLGSLVVLMSPHEPLTLVDDVPVLSELNTAPGDDHFATHRLEEVVPRGPAVDMFGITVEVDTERFAQMQSMNPIRPADHDFADCTPWFVCGSTPEVDRTAAAIRGATNILGYTRFQEAAAVLAFAQSMDYSLDEETT